MYTFWVWALAELNREQPSKPWAEEKMMTFEWYTVCFMSTLSDKSALDTTEHINIIIIICYVCGLIPSPQKSISYYCVRLCTTWHFLNMGQNFTPNFNLFDVAVATLVYNATDYWLLTALSMFKINRFRTNFKYIVKFDTILSISFRLSSRTKW